MTKERQQYLQSIANTIADYRKGEIEAPTPDHVNRWVNQFEDKVQLPLLRELDHVLKRTYFSKQRVMAFLRKLIYAENLTGNNPQEFWRSANFLDIQGGGDSQRDMLKLFSEVLRGEFSFGIEDCGQRDDVFIYLDDGLFTGNRVRQDIEKWVINTAPAQAKVYVVYIALHKSGFHYAKKYIRDAIQKARKNIDIEWRPALAIELENRIFNKKENKEYSDSSDVLLPTFIPDDPAVKNYVESMKRKPKLRPSGNPGTAKLFSSDEAKILLEQEFLKTGVRIRQRCSNLMVRHRPLGYMKLETLGFGSLIVTYRNCPNNAPLALWAGDPWYPLFPRVTNTQTAIRRTIRRKISGLTEEDL